MKILYVNHTSQVSGAERSLLELLSGMNGHWRALLACPTGSLASAAAQREIATLPIACIDGSLRIDPVQTPLALARLGFAALQVARHTQTSRVDLVHANSIRAGLVCVAARRLTGVPTVVHLRDCLPRTAMADTTMRCIARGASAIVANSDYTAGGLTAVAEPRGSVHVLANPVDLARFDPGLIDRHQARRRVGINEAEFALGVIGQITPWKGQADAIKVLSLLVGERPEAALYIVGEPKFVSRATRFDNLAYMDELHRLAVEAGLQARVHFLGEREDIPEVLAALDVVLVPSWEEPFGRVVVEAMAMGRTVIATTIGGPAAIIDDGVSGLLVQPRDPAAWAAAVRRVVADADLRRQLEREARARAADFDVSAHVAGLEAIYRQVRARPPLPARA